MYILTLKIMYPEIIHMLWSCHECSWLNRIFGLKDELFNLYESNDIFNQIIIVYNYLPVYALITNSNIICMSGGPTHEI